MRLSTLFLAFLVGVFGLGLMARTTLAAPAPSTLPSSPAPALSLTCTSTATTLEQVIECVRGALPRTGEGYVVPTAAQRTAWQNVVTAMMGGQCEAIALDPALDSSHDIDLFTDSETSKAYCILWETLDANNNGRVDRGWGTVIVDAAAQRDLVHTAPHPIDDLDTERQAIAVFKDTNSRAYILAGARRAATSTLSSCQTDHEASDVAHDNANMFHVATLAVANALVAEGATDYVVLQYHGMAANSCTSHVHMTYGTTIAPAATDALTRLRTNLLGDNPTWNISLPGTGPACSRNGTDNVQGRWLNNVPLANICSNDAAAHSRHFIHIEQDPNNRNAANWTSAIADTWPVP